MLSILVENRGRVNYGDNIDTQRKGGSYYRPGAKLPSPLRLVYLFAMEHINRPLGPFQGGGLWRPNAGRWTEDATAGQVARGGFLKGDGACFTCTQVLVNASGGFGHFLFSAS